MQERRLSNDKKIPLKGRVSRAALEREIREFEDLAQQMLNRMDIMLMTVGGVTNEKDPSRRLEVFKYYFFVSIIPFTLENFFLLKIFNKFDNMLQIYIFLLS